MGSICRLLTSLNEGTTILKAPGAWPIGSFAASLAPFQERFYDAITVRGLFHASRTLIAMPKPEEPIPWALTKGAEREPYPRKNLYFVGDFMDEIYDYCIWRANVDGYQMLDGSTARGSSDFITDQLTRAYLQTMLDSEKAEQFQQWRRRKFVAAGKTAQDAQLHPNGISLASKSAVLKSLGEAILAYVSETDSLLPVPRKQPSRKRNGKTKVVRRGKNTSTR